MMNFQSTFKLALLSSALASSLALADVVAKNGADAIKLTPVPCTVIPVLKLIDPLYHSQLFNATSTLKGEEYRACWMLDGGAVHLFYEDGDQGLVDAASFFKTEDK